MSQTRKNKKNEDAIEDAPRAKSSTQSNSASAFGAAAVPMAGLTAVPLPELEIGALAKAQTDAQPRQAAENARHQALVNQIPRDVPTATGPQALRDQQREALINQIPGQGPVQDGGAAFHEARMQARELNPLMARAEPTQESPEASSKTASAESAQAKPQKTATRPASAPVEPAPQVVARLDPKEVVKGMDPVTVVERAGQSETSLDSSQRVAYALRQAIDGKDSVAGAVARIEAEHGKEAAAATGATLASLGIDSNAGAQAPSKDALQKASAVADTAVLASFRDFREQQTLAAALPEDVRLAALETLTQKQTQLAEAAKAQGAAPSLAPVTVAASEVARDNELQAATQWLQEKAQAGGLGADAIDGITAAEMLHAARAAPSDTSIVIQQEENGVVTGRLQFTSGELLASAQSLDTKAQAADAEQAQARERKEAPQEMQVAQAEMEMGD